MLLTHKEKLSYYELTNHILKLSPNFKIRFTMECWKLKLKPKVNQGVWLLSHKTFRTNVTLKNTYSWIILKYFRSEFICKLQTDMSKLKSKGITYCSCWHYRDTIACYHYSYGFVMCKVSFKENILVLYVEDYINSNSLYNFR